MLPFTNTSGPQLLFVEGAKGQRVCDHNTGGGVGPYTISASTNSRCVQMKLPVRYIEITARSASSVFDFDESYFGSPF